MITNYNDSNQLQEDLERVTNWSKKWQLNFNIDKCKYMQIDHKLSTSYTLINEYDGKRTALDKNTDENNLGMWYTNALSPPLQCHKTTFKAMRSQGLIKRTFKYILKSTVTALFVQNVCLPSP